MSEYIVELDSKHSIALNLAFAEEMRGGDFVREEIVRCRDCKYGHEVVWPRSRDIPADYLDCTGKLTTTWDYYNDEPQANPVEPSGFCAWGVRREDA